MAGATTWASPVSVVSDLTTTFPIQVTRTQRQTFLVQDGLQVR